MKNVLVVCNSIMYKVYLEHSNLFDNKDPLSKFGIERIFNSKKI